jgi:IMP dehydrogenase/GMP reductase
MSWSSSLSETRLFEDAYTYDDVLIVPLKSDILPTEVRTTTRLTNRIELNIPIVSAAMDTVTESHLAIALAQQGGIGIIHKNMSIEKQAGEVDKVKRSESGMIVDPITMSPNEKIEDAVKLMAHYKISGVPITENGRLVGILTNRDLRFETRFHLPIREVMTKDNLVTVSVGTTLDEAQRILHQHRIEKLLVVDKNQQLKGLITVKDITKKIKYPLAAKDQHGRLRVGAGHRRLHGADYRTCTCESGCRGYRHSSRSFGPCHRSRSAGKAAVPGPGPHRRKHRNRGSCSRSGCCGSRCCEGWHGAWFDLHDARRQRRRHAANHRHHELR